METGAEHDASLLEALAQLGPSEHLCSIYESAEEHLAVAIPFIQMGLAHGEKCIYIADDGTQGLIQDAMRAYGIEVELALETGKLVLGTKDDAYLRDGAFDPAWTFTFWKEATAKAMKEGFSALRMTGETEWVVRGAPGLERWIEYESRFTHTLADHNCRVLCQYNRQLFTPELLLDVIRTHPTVIYRGSVCRNLYYVPADELLGPDRAAREVERLLTTLREREEIEHTLRRQAQVLQESEARFRQIAENIREVFWVWDVSADRLTFVSPMYEEVFGRSRTSAYANSRSFLESVADDDRARIEAATLRARAGSPTDEQYRVARPDGSIRWVRDRSFPVRDATGPVTHVVGVAEDVTARRVVEQALDASLSHARALTGRLMQVQDDERRRIARMLHETTAQDLAGLKLHLARLNRTASQLKQADRSALTDSIALAERSMAEIRTLSYLLHPPFLDEMGLLPALRWFAAGFAERSGINVELDLPQDLERPPLDIETALFRVVQESLTNIHRHAESNSARIQLRSEGKALWLEIADRGHGIARAALEDIMNGGGGAGVGIAGMRERVEQLGGQLQLESGEHGTVVSARLPLVRRAS